MISIRQGMGWQQNLTKNTTGGGETTAAWGLLIWPLDRAEAQHAQLPKGSNQLKS